MSMNDRKRMERVMEMVEDRAEAERALIDSEFTTPPLGQELVDDETFAAWFELKVQEHPATSWLMPDGTPIVASPWVLALTMEDEDGEPVVAGGLALVKRYERIRGITA